VINVLAGLFLWHPYPITFEGNTCSHQCAYCYANARCNNRASGIKQAVKILKGDSNSKSLENLLYKSGYPIVMSNRTDPFSENNYTETRVLAQIVAEKENGVYVQTKLGREEYVDEFLDIIANKRNVMFYISVSTQNDDVAKIVEPGAPPPSERKRIAKKIAKKGYQVTIAFNPLVEEWASREDVLRECVEYKAAGINHFFFQKLHLSKGDISGMPENAITALKESGIDMGKYTGKASRDRKLFVQYTAELAMLNGHHVMLDGMPFRTGYYDSVPEIYNGKYFPTHYHFANWACENKKPGEVITREEYIQSMEPPIRDIIDAPFKGIDKYILRTARQVWYGNMKVQSIKTYRELLGLIYDDKRINPSPRNSILFTENEKKELVFRGEFLPGMSSPEAVAERDVMGGNIEALEKYLHKSLSERRKV